MASSSTFCQVTFNDILKTYARSTGVTCQYTLAVGFQPTTRDWVGLFKVGWSSAKDYYSFVWVDPPVDLVEGEPVRKQCQFSDYYLPKEDAEFYQFCYVDSGGHVKGASTPFNFHYPVESMDCSLGTDLLVVTTQVEVDQSAQEKEALREALEQLRMESSSAQRALEGKELEVARLMEQSKEREKKESELVEELNRARGRAESLARRLKDKEQEAERLMEEISIQNKAHLERDQHNASEKETPEINTASEAKIQEKYDQAVVQIGQLKAELEERAAEREEIAALKLNTRGEKELLIKLRDRIQLLEVDLKFSERDKERLSAELNQSKRLTLDTERLESENKRLSAELNQSKGLTLDTNQLESEKQELRKSLTQQESRRQDFEAQCNTMTRQLESARTQLANERKESNDKRRRAEEAERELLNVKEQLHKADMEMDRMKQKSTQLKFRLTESLDIVKEKDAEIVELNGIIELRENRLKIQHKEKEDHLEENKRLRLKVDDLSRELMDLQAALNAGCLEPNRPPADRPPADRPPAWNTFDHVQGQQQNPESFQFVEPHHITGEGPNTQGKRMVCRSCHGYFPGITEDELDQHEQSHRVCPFCTLICDDMEQLAFENHVYSHEL